MNITGKPEVIVIAVPLPFTGPFIPFIEKRFGPPAAAHLLPSRYVRLQENHCEIHCLNTAACRSGAFSYISFRRQRRIRARQSSRT
jgi:hypothetical protein